jgi:hypothetical protein
MTFVVIEVDVDKVDGVGGSFVTDTEAMAAIVLRIVAPALEVVSPVLGLALFSIELLALVFGLAAGFLGFGNGEEEPDAGAADRERCLNFGIIQARSCTVMRWLL